MLNREDVRKILEARAKVVIQLTGEGKDIADIDMKNFFELVLGEIKKQEDFDKAKD